jgi:hypothetical protein
VRDDAHLVERDLGPRRAERYMAEVLLELVLVSGVARLSLYHTTLIPLHSQDSEVAHGAQL